MPELIDRELTQLLLDTEIKQFGGNWLQDKMTKNGLLIAKQIVSKQPKIEAEPVRHGRWIPVEDALPELDTMVIVCYYGSDCIFPMQGETVTEAVARQNKVPTVTMGFLDEEGWNGADMFPMMVQPTFWMDLPDAPLPEPPEKE